MLYQAWTHQIGVVPGQGRSLCYITNEVEANRTHSSSNHLRDIQVRVFLGDAILE